MAQKDNRKNRNIALGMLTLAIASGPLEAAETSADLAWSPEALVQMKTISDVQLSPDNQFVLFVTTEADMTKEKGQMCSKIYRKNTKDSLPATSFSSPQFSSMQPRWSPDGQWIAFLSPRDGVKNLYLISSQGGEAKPLTSSKQDVQTFRWSPDSKKIAFVMADETEAVKNTKKSSLAYVYQEKVLVNRLWYIDLFAEGNTAKALTPDAYCVRGAGDFGTTNEEFDWSPDSQKITFAFSPDRGYDWFHLDSSLATIDLSNGSILPWAKESAYEALPRYSPDGQLIAYLSTNLSNRYACNRVVTVRNADGTQSRILAPTYNEGPLIAGPTLLGWNQNGTAVFFFEPKETKFHITEVPVDGSPAQSVDTENTFFREPALSYDRTMIGCVVQTPAMPPEACIAKLKPFQITPVSSVNRSFLAYPKIETEIITWASQDGLAIEGLLTYPVGYDKSKKYPLLLVIHGGPMGFFDESFLGMPNPYPLASFAEEGFMILRVNPRGSTGYGKDFRCMIYKDWSGKDYIDLMTGIDMLIAQGMVDPNKLGVMGWSYGGYMTAWIITQTNRFQAASMGAGLCNLVSMNGTTDLYRFLTDYLGDFSENRSLYEARSPINYVSNVRTPCLIQHGSTDKRVPISQAYEFYHALARAGKETKLIIYPEMEHRIFDPKMQLDAMKQNLEWFQEHLNNKE